MRRRHALALCGTALTTLAGCGGRQSDTATPGRTLSVQPDGLQPAVVQLFVDAYEFEARAGSQYLFLSGPDATGPERRFRFDGTDHEPGVDTSYDLVRAPSTFGPPTDASDWTVFELPETGEASDAALVAPDGEWRPGEPLRTRLAAPLPTLAVTGFTAPSVLTGSRPTFTVTVRNPSDHVGRFLGILRPPDGSYRPGQLVARDVPAEGSTTLEATGEPVATPTPGTGGSDGDTLEYELAWPGGSTTTSLSVQ